MAKMKQPELTNSCHRTSTSLCNHILQESRTGSLVFLQDYLPSYEISPARQTFLPSLTSNSSCLMLCSVTTYQKQTARASAT
jgi:hypothetical protein